MKKIMMATVAMLVCMTASAQYPDLTNEAKQLIEQQKKQWKAHADSAWEIAFPIVVKEAKEGTINRKDKKLLSIVLLPCFKPINRCK